MAVTAFRWPLALVAAGALIGAAQGLVAGPLPGDVALTRAMQSWFGFDAPWASWITRTARAPTLWATLALAVVLAGIVSGWRAAVGPAITLGVAHGLDLGLRALYFAPRPSAAVVAVASAGDSSGLPSTLGLVYGALFGGLLAGFAARTAAPRALAALALLLMLAGASARVVPGGHWPSQMLASLCVAAGIALAVRRVLATNRRLDP